MRTFAKQQCSKRWRKEGERQEQAAQSLNTDSYPSKPNLFSFLKKIEINGRPWRVTCNLTSGAKENTFG